MCSSGAGVAAGRRVAGRARHDARHQRDPRAEGRPARVRRHRGVRRSAPPGSGGSGRGRPLRPLLHHPDAAGRPAAHVRGSRTRELRWQRAARRCQPTSAADARRSASPRPPRPAVAICLLNAYANPDHERVVARRTARRAPRHVRGRVDGGLARDARVRARDDHRDVRVRRAGHGRVPRAGWRRSSPELGIGGRSRSWTRAAA